MKLLTSKRPRVDQTTYFAAPAPMVRQAFGRRLAKASVEKGWSGAELARRATKAGGLSIGKYSISRYEAGAQFPEPQRVEALAKALGVKPADLLPDLQHESPEPARGMDAQVNADTGKVWLRLNQAVSLDKAQKIMHILAEPEDA